MTARLHVDFCQLLYRSQEHDDLGVVVNDSQTTGHEPFFDINETNVETSNSCSSCIIRENKQGQLSFVCLVVGYHAMASGHAELLRTAHELTMCPKAIPCGTP